MHCHVVKELSKINHKWRITKAQDIFTGFIPASLAVFVPWRQSLHNLFSPLLKVEIKWKGQINGIMDLEFNRVGLAKYSAIFSQILEDSPPKSSQQQLMWRSKMLKSDRKPQTQRSSSRDNLHIPSYKLADWQTCVFFFHKFWSASNESSNHRLSVLRNMLYHLHKN